MAKMILIGTRGSRLALAQSQIVLGALKAAHPGVEFAVVTISTKGDANRAAPVAAIGVGVFVKELEAALADGRIDLAVHSAKDMPTVVPEEFTIASVLEREDPRDALLSRDARRLEGLPRGARVATGSARRKALLLSVRPDLAVEPIRGNVDTRLSKLQAEGGPDAIVLAAAGLARLGRLSEASEVLDPAVFVPAVGQGALALETRSDDEAVIRMTLAIQHLPSRQAVEAERAFLLAVGGGCSAPVSAHATVERRRVVVSAFAADPGGRQVVRHMAEGQAAEAAAVGKSAAKALLEKGGAQILGRSPAAMGHASFEAGGGDD